MSVDVDTGRQFPQQRRRLLITWLVVNMCAWCRHTRGRFERAHGDVLSGHMGFFSLYTTRTHTHHDHKHTTQHATSHGDRDRERQSKKTDRERESEQEDRERERREDEREEDKREREKMKEKPHFFLLNRVKYDSSLISFSASWQAKIFFKKILRNV